MSRREAMSSIDTAWLRMDRPANRMMIIGVLSCERRVSCDRLREAIASRFLRHHRFRQRVVMDGDTPYWEDDPDFDLSVHVRRTALPGTGGKRGLQELVGELLGTPFDSSRPLWQFHLVEKYGRGSALVARIHHCYADGIALMQVLLSLTDDSSSTPENAGAAPGIEDERSALQWLAPVTRTMETALRAGAGMAAAYVDLVMHPGHAVDYARQGIGLAVEAGRLALMPTDSLTRFKGRPTGIKRAAWTDRLPLHEIKAMAHATGCSVNDVLMSCVAGALRAGLVTGGDSPDGVEVRALVPVNMRQQTDAEALGNRFGLIAVLLPLGLANPLERLYQVKNRMQESKASNQAFVTLSLLATVGMGPKALQKQILDLLANRATAVVTNVPGPEQARYLTGSRVREIVFWVPQSSDIGLGMSVLSYDNGLQFGIVADKGVVSDPQSLAASFAEELDALRLAVAGGRAPARGRAATVARRAVRTARP